MKAIYRHDLKVHISQSYESKYGQDLSLFVKNILFLVGFIDRILYQGCKMVIILFHNFIANFNERLNTLRMITGMGPVSTPKFISVKA